MSTQGANHVVEGTVRGEALVVAELGTARPHAQKISHRLASRGSVALFTDSFEGMGAVAAKSLVRDGYAVRLYCAVSPVMRRSTETVLG
jgi:hypothetical protein